MKRPLKDIGGLQWNKKLTRLMALGVASRKSTKEKMRQDRLQGVGPSMTTLPAYGAFLVAVALILAVAFGELVG